MPNHQKKFEPILGDLFEEIREIYNDLSARDADTVNLAKKDVVTEVDREITKLVQNYFERIEGNYRLESEELNKSSESPDTKLPDFSVVFDEIDGTTNMKDGTGPFGPIVGIAKTGDPTFKDMVAAGFLNLQNGTLYEAYRNKGAYRTNRSEGKKSINTSQRTQINDEESIMRLLVDQAMLGEVSKIADEAWKNHCNDYGSMGQHLCWVADGSVDAFVTGGFSYMPEKDQNTAEEIGPLYLLVKEAGGSMTDWESNKIGGEKLGMKSKKNHNVIVAATQKLAEEISEQIVPEENR